MSLQTLQRTFLMVSSAIACLAATTPHKDNDE
jgi:hypothetical protein